MRRRIFDPGVLIVCLIVVLCAAMTAPYIMLTAQGVAVSYGPVWLWPVVFAGFTAAYLATTFLAEHPTRGLATLLFAVHQVLAIASVLLLHTGMGFVPVILVFGAALSCYVLPVWGTVVVVAVNTVAVVVSTLGLSSADVVVSAAFYLAIQAVSVFSVITWRAQEKSQRRLTEAHVELAATNALLEQSTRAEERLRISRDLHDVAGHQLTALALELEIAAHHADGEAQEHVLRARAVAKDLLRDVRSTVSQLREERGSLEETLRATLAGVQLPVVELTVERGLDADAERTTAFVRATQEALTNTVRHAESASTLRIAVTREARAHEGADAAAPRSDVLVLDAADDGWAPTRFELGNGLRGMRERAEALGGSAWFGRGDNGGFRVKVEVPV